MRGILLAAVGAALALAGCGSSSKSSSSSSSAGGTSATSTTTSGKGSSSHSRKHSKAGGSQSGKAPAIPGQAHGKPTKATVRFIAPKPGSVVSGHFVAVVDLRRFELDVAGIGKSNKPGHGHLEFSLDGGKLDTTAHTGLAAQLAARHGGKGRFSISASTKITYDGIPPGRHTLVVLVVENDGSPLAASDSTTFTVR
jgi:hypothetical protein